MVCLGQLLPVAQPPLEGVGAQLAEVAAVVPDGGRGLGALGVEPEYVPVERECISHRVSRDGWRMILWL